VGPRQFDQRLTAINQPYLHAHFGLVHGFR
jgi:hypothetical protein